MSLKTRASVRPAAQEFEKRGCLPTLDAGPVRLRWLMDADIPVLFTIFGDPEVTRYWGLPRLSHLSAAAALLSLSTSTFVPAHCSS